MIQVLKSVNLFLVEVIHLLRCDDSVIVEVNNLKPIVESLNSRFVLLAEHEVNKIFVAHLSCLFSLELAGNLLENTVDCLAGKSVALIPAEVLLVNDEVMIAVKFPKAAIKHIEVLI